MKFSLATAVLVAGTAQALQNNAQQQSNAQQPSAESDAMVKLDGYGKPSHSECWEFLVKEVREKLPCSLHCYFNHFASVTHESGNLLKTYCHNINWIGEKSAKCIRSRCGVKGNNGLIVKASNSFCKKHGLYPKKEGYGGYNEGGYGGHREGGYSGGHREGGYGGGHREGGYGGGHTEGGYGGGHREGGYGGGHTEGGYGGGHTEGGYGGGHHEEKGYGKKEEGYGKKPAY